MREGFDIRNSKRNFEWEFGTERGREKEKVMEERRWLRNKYQIRRRAKELLFLFRLCSLSPKLLKFNFVNIWQCDSKRLWNEFGKGNEFLNFSFNFELKKKTYAKRRCLVGLTAIITDTITEPWIDKNWKWEDWIDKTKS